MSTIAQTGFTDDSFATFLESRVEPPWLVDRRRQAWQVYRQLDWPARNQEEWIRTDTRLFNPDRYAPPAADSPHPTELPAGLLAEGVELGGRVETCDSHARQSWLADRWARQGVVFGSLAALSQSHGDLLQEYLMRQAFDTQYDRFAALHAACWAGGALVYVPRGVVLDQPLHVLSALTDGATDTGHILVVLDEGAQATLLCENASTTENGGGLHCGGLEMIVQPGAHLRLVNLQHWGTGVWHFAHQHAVLHRDAALQWTVGALGGRLAKVNQTVTLVGPGAESQVNGAMFTQGRQHLAYHTLQHHVAPHCHSDFLYKAALQDKSRTVWRGMIKVDAAAQQTNGYQRNDNLLLSSAARADSIPGLEIEADDVRCTHGSTSGQVDEELIFYAMCRGYTHQEAVRMIVSGFFQQIFDRIPLESVREALGQAIARRVRAIQSVDPRPGPG